MGVRVEERSLDLDVEHSTVNLAGRRFPATAMLCPPVEGRSRVRYDRMLGYLDGVFIPAENGALLFVSAHERGLDVWLHAPTCVWESYPNLEDQTWMPAFLVVAGREIVPHLRRKPLIGVGYWLGADPEWVGEHIDRLSRLPCRLPDGPPVTLLSLAEADAIVRDHGSRRRSKT